MSDISPSVTVQEAVIDTFTNVSNSDLALFVGEFEKGPTKTPILVTSILQFKLIFGRATEENYNQWYQVYNYLTYSQNILICRTCGMDEVNAFNEGFVANSPGPWGNIMSVEVYDGELQENKNIILSYFDEYTTGKYIVLVKRLGKVVEKFAVQSTSEISSNYLQSFEDKYGIFELSGGFISPATSEDYMDCYDMTAKENYDIDIVLSDEDHNVEAINYVNYRKDCVAYIGIPRKYFDSIKTNDDILTTEDGLIINLGGTEFKYEIDNMNFTSIQRYVEQLPKSDYVFCVAGFMSVVDGFTSKIRLINVISSIAGLKSRLSETNKWQIPVGYIKGNIDANVLIQFTKKERDELYKQGINTLENSSLMTQKMLGNKKSVVSKLHVRNITNKIIRESEKILQRFTFDFNDLNTRRNIAMQIKLYLDSMVTESALDNAKVKVSKGDKNNSININIIISVPTLIERIQINITNVGENIISDIIGG